MAGVTAAAVVGAGATMYASNKASKAAKAGRKQAADLARKGAAAFAGIDIPTLEQQEIILKSPELMGEYTPEQLSAMELSVNGLAQIGPEDSSVESQKGALEQITEMAEGGVTEADLAAQRQIERGAAQSGKARREAILSEMAQRGVLGSGMELAAQLQGEQQTAAEAGDATDKLIQQNQANRMAALQQQAALSGQMRGQESQESMDKYRAQKQIEQFNLGLRHQDAQERNRAQQMNLASRQAQEDARVQASNQQQMYNKQLKQQQFQNEMQKASGLANQYQAQQANAVAAGNAEAQRQAGIGSTIANLAGTLGSAFGGK